MDGTGGETILGRMWRTASCVSIAVRTARGPLLIIAFVYTPWILSEPFRELFSAYSENAVASNRPNLIPLAYLGAFCAGMMISFFITILIHAKKPAGETLNNTEVLLSTIAGGYVLLLFLAVTLPDAEASLRVTYRAISAGELTFDILYLAYITAGALGAALLMLVNILKLRHRPRQEKSDQSTTIFALFIVFFAVVLIIAFSNDVGYSNLSPEQISRTEPSISDSALTKSLLMIALWFMLFSGLSLFRLPLLEMSLLLVVVCAYFNLSDNHPLRTLKGEIKPIPTVADAFEQWVVKRVTHDHRRLEEFPVYVVAAEGGGIYAAIHSAAVLGRLQAAEPKFSSHLFAASGVSGGSLGLAFFSSYVAAATARCSATSCGGASVFRRADYEASLKKFASYDLLSPLIARFLGSDLLQWMIPWPVVAFDRTVALEDRIQVAWVGTAYDSGFRDNSGAFQQSFWSQWKPEENRPALLLNATRVETGARLVFSPFSLNGTSHSGDMPDAMYQDVGGPDMALSTAVVASARFPYLTPAGHYLALGNDGSRERRRLVDGGYFDNTGVETAVDLIRALKRIERERKIAEKTGLKGIKFILVSISTKTASYVGDEQGLSELLSPVRAMIGSWRVRSDITFRKADLELGSDKKGVPLLRRIVMDPGDKELPLSWVLSTTTRDRIIDGLIASDQCPAPAKTTKDSSSCSLRSVVNELRR